jgi:ABC-2 type transport system permease protein
MHQWMKIFRFEIFTLISRFSFWFGLLGIPLIGFVLINLVSMINQGQPGTEAAIQKVTQMMSSPEDKRPQGFVDLSGIIKTFPPDIDQRVLIRFSDESTARKNLDNGTVQGYYVVPSNYIAKGVIPYYRKSFELAADGRESSNFKWIIRYNLLGNQAMADLFEKPIKVDLVPLIPPAAPRRDQENVLTLFLPYAMMMLFYFFILGTASLMLSSISKEKENRVLESLLVSVTPFQLLTGKIIGLGVVGLFQVMIWLVSGLFMLQFGGQALNLSQSYLLPPSILIWAVPYFILGYIVYASFMAGIGALAPNLREGSQTTTLVMIPLMVPLFFISLLVEEPNGTVATILSLFPLTSPTTMMMRLSIGAVPIWQNILALLLLLGMAYLSIRAVSGMFRAQTMLSGQPFNIKRYILALFGKA